MAGTPFHYNVSLRGFHFEDFMLTGILADGITTDDVGKAIALDAASGANCFKLAGAGEIIVGRLESVEDREVEGNLVGAIAFRFANTLPIVTGSSIAVGDTAVGSATAGQVDRLEDTGAAAPNHSINFVAEIIGTDAVVVKL